ncbi:MAG: 2-amino-4-hydroxy-6-hydroxymethyldihydropteridine diphosphokinase [Verrucomicrobia bacterium]|nr:2-amino-4-hydroxy-6-hydroxymethyldihydropteridine diphosphokinase [Verrucomicrobiota bacterium]
MVRAGIALGSNLGDRLANLRAARVCLEAISSDPKSLRSAPVYQTEPVLCPAGSPEFFNTVIEIEVHATPLELLSLTQEIERKLGRPTKAPRNAPRIIDVDLLYMGSLVFNSPTLTLPHPRLAERRFVLAPLADINPDLMLPGQSETVASLKAGLKSTETEPIVLLRHW